MQTEINIAKPSIHEVDLKVSFGAVNVFIVTERKLATSNNLRVISSKA